MAMKKDSLFSGWRPAVIVLLMMVMVVLPASAATHTVTSNASGSIQAAIDIASSGDIIVLKPGTYFQNGMKITGKSLTFRAAAGYGPADTIIDGKSAAPRIFTVLDGSSLTIENLALRNGRAGDAACGDPFISLGNNCGDGGYGGAIYSAGNVALTSSTITGSSAGNGGNGSNPFLGLGGNGGNGGNGGAIYTKGTVALTSSMISGCSAGDAGDGGEDDPILGGEGMGGMGGSGGAIYAIGTITLTSSTLVNSHAGNGGSGANQKPGFYSVGGSGGAIYGAGPVTFTSSMISGCSAGNGGNGGNDNRGYDGGSGGAIAAGGAVTITKHSTISGCSAGNGGAGGPGSGAANMGAWGGDGGHGGAIIAGGPVTISTTTIENSRAGTGGAGGAGGWFSGHPSDGSPGGNGGAVYSAGAVTLTSATISGCSAGSGGAGGEGHNARDGGNGGNGGSGGAVYSANTVTLGSSAVTSCFSGSGGAGGSGGWAASDGSTGTYGNAGGIYTNAGTVTAADSRFASCGTGGNGGAIYANTGPVAVTDSKFSSFAAGGNGGAIYANGEVTATNSTFALWGAGGNGGAIYSNAGVRVIRSSFQGIFTRDGDGGAIYANWVVVDKSSFYSCNAHGSGGAIFTLFETDATSSDFTLCSAASGSVIYVKYPLFASSVIHYNRLVGNSGQEISVLTGKTADARYNWWGANNNPSALVSSQVLSSPWLVLGDTATPASITMAQTSMVRANLTYDSAGGYHDPASGHVPDGIPVTFAVASGPGSVLPASATTSTGISQTLFTPLTPGTARVTATVDSQTVVALISIANAPLPAVTGIMPASGLAAGGTEVTITGTGFTGATAVKFDNLPAAAFTVKSDTEIIATSPPHAAGTIDVNVTTPGGTSPAVAADLFTYNDPTPPVLAITGIVPASGPIAGGTAVTITGTGFTGATAVSFGTISATTFTVKGDSKITVTSPAGTAGTVDITVTTAEGTSAVVAADRFTYSGNTPIPEFPALVLPAALIIGLLGAVLFIRRTKEN